MPKFRFRDGRLVGDDGLPMLNQEERARPLQVPRVFGDLPAYASPLDGRMIEGRRARRYDLERSNCVDGRELPSPTNGKLRNERFAKKYKLEHLLER